MKVHLIGIGGVGMAALAVLLKRRGHCVTGCDVHASPRTEWLVREGIPVAVGHDPAHAGGQDLVIVTPAVAEDNPEYVRARTACPVRHRGEVLADLVGEAADAIAVCGSHGKTTTATFIAKLLLALGEGVEWAIGGETGSFPVAGASGRGSVLVVEADESDGTLARYRAKTLVVTNCEYDHADHFPTPADYRACYETAKRQAQNVVEGASADGEWLLGDLETALGPSYAACSAAVAALAPHNRRNARLAVEVALRRGHASAAVAAALPAVVAVLPDRRFQRLAIRPPASQRADPVVYTDYAHHPTEMKCAVAMARAVCRGKLRVLFQPHRYSRTKALLAQFPAAFEGADEVVLCPTYAAFEQPVAGGDIADLYAACRTECRCRLHLARTCEEAWYHARLSMDEGDVTLLLGAGDIIALAPLVESWAEPPRRRFWIGQGTNTWRTDLATNDEYAKSDSPAGRPGAALLAEHPALLPWMAGIPGTVGGWLKMNAGAFGHSISEVVASVKVDGRWIAAADCGFGYRTSSLAGEIQDVRLVDAAASPRRDDVDASEGNGESPESYLARRAKFPPGTKGSVFRNPPGDFAGRLLEAAGVKGLRVGGAYVWENHANVIVSGPDATASDFLALARLMRLRVLHRFGVRLDPEVRF